MHLQKNDYMQVCYNVTFAISDPSMLSLCIFFWNTTLYTDTFLAPLIEELVARGFDVVTAKIPTKDTIKIVINKEQIWIGSLNRFQSVKRKRSDPMVQEAVQKVLKKMGGPTQHRPSQHQVMQK
ncbi:hypothetical protein ACF0H5_001465 [Mactra antiquata]